MDLKVSIHLPNDVTIVIEASEPALARQMMRLAFKTLPHELTHLSALPNDPSLEAMRTTKAQEAPDSPEAEERLGEQAEGDAIEELVQFCHRLAPMGDMRRVVVAAVGSDRYLGMKSVSPREMGKLFDLAGWPQPGSFVQTLRNAARSKFRWLARVPGRAGYYSATPKGKDVVAGPGEL